MEKIAEITDPAFRTGIGKKGTPWTLMKIKTDTGKEASLFAPASIGDPVKLTFNDQYNNYSAEVMNARKMEAIVEKEKQDDKLADIDEKLDLIIELLQAKPIPKEKDKDEVAFDDGEIDLEDIPF